MLLDNHIEYFGVFQEMQRQEDELQRSFEELDLAAEAAGLPPARARRQEYASGGATGVKAGREVGGGRASTGQGQGRRARGRGQGEQPDSGRGDIDAAESTSREGSGRG